MNNRDGCGCASAASLSFRPGATACDGRRYLQCRQGVSLDAHLRHGRMPRLTGPMQGDADEDFQRIRLLVRRRRGVDLADYRRSYVLRRLSARMRTRRAAGAGAYARIFGAEPDEVRRPLAALST